MTKTQFLPWQPKLVWWKQLFHDCVYAPSAEITFDKSEGEKGDVRKSSVLVTFQCQGCGAETYSEWTGY